MKKFVSILLALVMLLCLCACSKNEEENTAPGTDPGQATTDNTTVGGTTESTQDPTDNLTTTSAKEPTNSTNLSHATKDKTTGTTINITNGTHAPTKKLTTAFTHPTAASATTPTRKPTETPTTKPDTCEHTYTEVSCTVPKMCTKCQHIAGNALPHDYKNGACTVCGRTEILVTFTEGDWVARTVKNGTDEQGEVLSEYVLGQDKGHYSSVICFSNASACLVSTGKVVYNDTAYHSDWYYTTFTNCVWEENEDTVTVTLGHTDPIIEFVLTKTSETQLTVISSTNTAYVPVGIVFNKT